MTGRPLRTIDTYFEDIQTMYCDKGLSSRTISANLRDIYGVSISYGTIIRRIEEWGLEKGTTNNQYDVVRDPAVVAFVKQEWRDNASHQEILHSISIAMPHVQITDRQLRTLREENKIIYRRRGDIQPDEEEAAKAAIDEVLTEHGGAYGRGLVQVALRRDGILVSQYNLRSWQRELDPGGMCSILCPARAFARVGSHF
jgi:hypothetical protein